MKCPRCIEIHLLERWRLSQWNMYYLIDIDGSTSQINYWNRIECYAIGLKLKHFCSKNLFYGFDLHQPEYIITHEAVLIPCFCLKSQHNSTASGSESHSIPTLNPPLNLLCVHRHLHQIFIPLIMSRSRMLLVPKMTSYWKEQLTNKYTTGAHGSRRQGHIVNTA